MHATTLLSLLLFFVSAAQAQDAPTHDLLVKGGMLLDGSGSAARRADVAIANGRIVAVGKLGDATARQVIDATGLIVAPGFIDLHAHADGTGVSRPKAENFARMGVTSIITGNCGSSMRNLAKHFSKIEKQGISINYGSLVGHGTVRQAAMGRERRRPTAVELDKMSELVDRGMKAGAFGLSTGLIYVPGTYAETEELIVLSRVVARHGGVYATHMRSEGSRVLDAIDEALRIGREAKLRVHLSHLKASGRPNWGRSRGMIEKLEKARKGGLEVTGDQYAYAASSTSLDVLFPSKELAIGRARFGLRLKQDSKFRKRMEKALLRTMDQAGFGDFGYCQIGLAPNNPDLSGLSLKEAATRRFGESSRESQARLTVDLFIESTGKRIGMVYHKMNESDVEALMRQPWICVASDGGILGKGPGKPHPRSAGNNPRVLGHFVRDRKTLGLPLAIAKMTSLPARIFRIRERGMIRKGYFADLTLFDPETVSGRATFKEPKLAPVGIPHVIVGGVPVISSGRHTNARPGRVLRLETKPR